MFIFVPTLAVIEESTAVRFHAVFRQVKVRLLFRSQ
jgi:hypothetical protein